MGLRLHARSFEITSSRLATPAAGEVLPGTKPYVARNEVVNCDAAAARQRIAGQTKDWMREDRMRSFDHARVIEMTVAD